MSDRVPSRRAPLPSLVVAASPRVRALVVCAAVVIVLAMAGDALACPTCKDGVAEADPEGVNVARGYFYSILLMLGMPFTLAGTFGVYVWREMRRQERERLRSGQGGAAPLAGLPPTGGVVRGA